MPIEAVDAAASAAFSLWLSDELLALHQFRTAFREMSRKRVRRGQVTPFDFRAHSYSGGDHS